MTALELVSTNTHTGVRVRVTMPAVHQCPFKHETDQGTATVEWFARVQTVELHSLRAHLDSLAELVVSHEKYTGDLFNDILDLGLGGVAVTTEWDTAGGRVTVTRP